MEAPIEVLRIEQSAVSKEISRFRPCDNETRCFYCRDWAQYIYKKHFVWTAKTQEEVVSPETCIKAGPYELSFLDQDVIPKERATKLAKRFEKLLSKGQARAIDIFEACQLWTKLPSAFSGLPDMFDRIEFNPFPDAIPLVEDASDPAQLLDPLVIERQSLCLPSDSFHLLKNLTGDILLSHTQPTCDHMKPESKSPAELEVDRAIFNESVVGIIDTALNELKLALDKAWEPLYVFLEKMEQHEHRRSRLMGTECKAEMDEFVKNQNYTPFVDYWTANASLFKKKKGVSAADELKNIDKMVEDRLSELEAKEIQFLTDFAVPRLEQIQVLTSDLWKLMVPTFAEMGKRMEQISVEKGGKPKKLFKQPSQITLDEVDSTKEVKKAKELFTKELEKRIKSHKLEIDELLAFYREARPEHSARIEKLNNKEFKKRVKKVESGYYSIRQFYQEQVVSNLFPDSLFCKCVLYCLEPLMQEGEVMEAMTIEKEIKRFIETHSELLMNRCHLLDSFEEGVQIGRSELAGILGKLFLKEGMRIQGETLALKRQNMLLKSMGVSDTESSPKKKSKKKKGNASANSPAQNAPPEIPSTPVKTEEEEKPAAPPPLSRADRLRLVVSGTRTSEQKAKEEPKSDKNSPATNEKKDEPSVEKKTTKTENVKSVKENVDIPKKEEPKVDKKEEAVPTKKKNSKAVKKEEPKPVEEEPKAIKKEEPKPVKKDEPKVVKKEEPKVVKKEEPKPVKKEEPKVAKKEEPKVAKKEEPKVAKKEEPKVAKKEELKPVKKEEPKVIKKEEPKVVKKEEPKPAKKEELKPVKKEESKVIKKEEPKVAKKEEPKSVKKEEPKVVKKEEPKVVKKEEPKPAKKEEPKPVTVDEPKPVKKEEPKVVKKEEPKSVKKEEPKPVKKEEPKPITEEAPKPRALNSEQKSITTEKASETINREAAQASDESSTVPICDESPKTNQDFEVKDKMPRVFENENFKIEWSEPQASETKEDTIQDWNDMRKSVIESNTAVKDDWKNVEKEPESWNTVVKDVIDEPILNWNALRSEVTGSLAKNSITQSTKETTENAWSSSSNAVNQTGASIDNTQNDWTTVSKKKTVNGDITGQGSFSALNNGASDAWSTANSSPIASANNAWSSMAQSSKPVTDTSSGGWNNSEIKAPEASSALGGWGSPSSSTPSWERQATADTVSWEKKPSASNSTASSTTGWDRKATASPSNTWDRRSNTSISNPSTKLVNKSTVDTANWTNDKLPWTDDPVDVAVASKEAPSPLTSTPKPPGLSQEQSPLFNDANKPSVLSKEQSPLVNNLNQPPGLGQEQPPLFNNPSQPPGLPQEQAPLFNNSAQPAGLSTEPSVAFNGFNKPPGLSGAPAGSLDAMGNTTHIPSANPFATGLNPMAHTQPFPISLNQSGMSIPPSLNMMAPLSMPFMGMPNMPYQAPLPDRMDELDTGSLSLLVRNLHQQNGQLIQSVHSMQQEMNMLTTHYSDVVTRTREKETQTLQLMESRRKTEMDEARRYVEKLESRLQRLEEQSKNAADRFTAGFGNQDLFAGYREEMGTSEHRPYNNYRKKQWSKSTIIRCSNCGKTGHPSNECRSICRYCGSSEHLSDVCPHNE